MDLDRSGTNSRKGIGRPHAAVVMGMNADLAGEARLHGRRDRGNLIGHGAAVGIAENEDIGTPFGRRGECCHREVRVILVAVEKMLGIVENLPPLLLQIGDALPDHRQIFGMGNPEHLVDLKLPTLAKDRDDGCLRLEKLGDLGILGNLDAGTTGASKSGELGLPKIELPGLGKEGKILGIGTGPPSLDDIHAEGCQLFGDTDLIEQAERDPLTLRSITQGGVVKGNGDLGFHRIGSITAERLLFNLFNPPNRPLPAGVRGRRNR